MIELLDYNPYGTERLSWGSGDSGEAESQKTYIGEYSDSETNLSYLNARYYDPSIGRFLSQDPWFGDLTNPQSLNKYSYAENNPLKYIDPTGLFAEDTFDSGAIKIMGAGNSAKWATPGLLMNPYNPLGWLNAAGAGYDLGMGIAEAVSATWNAEPVSNEYTFVETKSEMLGAGLDVVEFYAQEATESFNQIQEGLQEDWQSVTGSESTQNNNKIVETTFTQPNNTPPASTTQPNYSTDTSQPYTCPDTSQTASTTTSTNWQNNLNNFVKENKNK
ncbi:MAG: RHS repeat-associated core domain-containing protein [Patescibacteria group bacterium]